VLALVAAGPSSAWNAGGSILTFYFPVGLFVIIAGLLWLQFAQQQNAPRRNPLAVLRMSPSAAAPPGDSGGDPVGSPGPGQGPSEPGGAEAEE
jgi:hypothetical protein